MNESFNSTSRITWVLSTLIGGLLVWLLSGCAHHRAQAQPREVYASDEAMGCVIHIVNNFYEPLSPYGHWEITGAYGRCWIPDRVDRDWRPYSNGYWQRTEAGWYWASDEPWGWATYHYGRWNLSTRLGWYWMPQTQWAPAWVSWRQGGGDVGWAPLSPSAGYGRNGYVEVNPSVITPRYVFVEERHFVSPVRPVTVIAPNTTIINKTVNISKIKVVNNTVFNEGPLPMFIEQASGQKLQPVPVRELRYKEEAAVVVKPRPPSITGKRTPPAQQEHAEEQEAPPVSRIHSPQSSQ